MNLRFPTLLLLLCLFVSWAADAQLPTGPKRKRSRQGPTALLIILPTYQSRVKYLQSAGDTKMLDQLNRDTKNVWKSMLRDFGNYFTYCPVYFFVDSNYDAVIRQDFEGVLLDTNMHPVSTPVIGKGDTAYMIGSYTYHVRQKGEEAVNDEGKKENRMFDGDMEASALERLVLHNYRMEQLQLPEPRVPVYKIFSYSLGEVRSRYGSVRRQLLYRSKSFNIVYKPTAAIADIVLTRYYGR